MYTHAALPPIINVTSTSFPVNPFSLYLWGSLLKEIVCNKGETTVKIWGCWDRRLLAKLDDLTSICRTQYHKHTPTFSHIRHYLCRANPALFLWIHLHLHLPQINLLLAQRRPLLTHLCSPEHPERCTCLASVYHWTMFLALCFLLRVLLDYPGKSLTFTLPASNILSS